MDIYRNLPFLLCLAVLSFNVYGAYPDPEFDVQEVNVTVTEGRTAVLPCSIENLGDLKVVWSDMWSTLLTYEDRRIIDDPRISVERPYVQDWNLHIRDVAYTDRGTYSCQINTNIVMAKTVNLDVLVPPKMIEEQFSGDQIVEEGKTVDLVCNMTGVPKPVVTWYRDHRSSKEVVLASGEVFTIQKVSRVNDGTYVCVGSNGISSDVSAKIKVNVYFAPEVSPVMNRIVQLPGRDTLLECEIAANPPAAVTWSKTGSNLPIIDNLKYRLTMLNGGKLKYSSVLMIIDLQQEDFGEYICSAENDLGQDQASVILAEYIHVTDTTSTPTTATTELQVNLTSSKPVDEGNATQTAYDTSTTPGKDTSMIKATRMEFYREQILTYRKWRQMMDTEKTFYEAMIKFLQQRKKENIQ